MRIVVAVALSIVLTQPVLAGDFGDAASALEGDVQNLTGRVQTNEDSILDIEHRLQALEAAPTPPEPSPPAPVTCDDELTEFCTLVSAMEPGVWYEIPNSAIEPHLPGPEEVLRHWGMGPLAPLYVIHDWCGGAFDGRRFYAHCGGHKGWHGNAVYAFDFTKMAWERLIDDSPTPEGTAENACPYPLEGPKAVHTYDGIVYSSETNSLFRWGGTDFCHKPTLSDPRTNTREYDTWEYLLPHGPWVQHDDPPEPHNFNNASALDPLTGNIFMSTKNELWIFDPRTKIYTHGGIKASVDLGTMVLDTNNRKLVALDRHGVMVFDVAAGSSIGPQQNPVLRGHIPENILLNGGGNLGLAYDSARDRFVIWDSTRNVYTLEIDYQAMTGEMRLYPNVDGPAPTVSRFDSSVYPKVYSKWQYFPEADVFFGYNNYQEGMWLYRMPGSEKIAGIPEPPVPTIDGDIRVCHSFQMADWCDYATLKQAISVAQPGDTIVIAPGVYKQAAEITKEGLTLVGESGAHLKGMNIGSKAALVVRADNVTIEGIECSDVADNRNISCVRNEATGLAIRNVYFHDFDIGINGGPVGSTILIEDSIIGPSTPGYRNHNIYISKWAGEVTLRNNRILCANEGHLVKSGAERNIIENNVLAGPDCAESRAVDIVLGGEVVIRGNVIQKSPAAENGDVFGIALEAAPGTAKDFHPVNSTLIEGNTIICDRSCRLVNSNSPSSVEVMGNTIVGPDLVDTGDVNHAGNAAFANRQSAGLPAFPELPQQP